MSIINSITHITPVLKGSLHSNSQFTMQYRVVQCNNDKYNDNTFLLVLKFGDYLTQIIKDRVEKNESTIIISRGSALIRI